MFFTISLVGVLLLFAVWDAAPFFAYVETLPIWLRSVSSIALLGLVPALIVVAGGILDMVMDRSQSR